MRTARLILIVLALLTASFALGSDHPDIDKGPSCELCEMSRDKFSHSRALINWEDGTTTSVCSINCVAAKLDPPPALKVKNIMVADKHSKELIDAEKAFWVVGGDERGVMTKEPKWAFSTKEKAEDFIKKHGGEMKSWEETWKLAKQDIKKRMAKPDSASSHEKMENMPKMHQ